jgi:hypothetical protein
MDLIKKKENINIFINININTLYRVSTLLHKGRNQKFQQPRE